MTRGFEPLICLSHFSYTKLYSAREMADAPSAQRQVVTLDFDTSPDLADFFSAKEVDVHPHGDWEECLFYTLSLPKSAPLFRWNKMYI